MIKTYERYRAIKEYTVNYRKIIEKIETPLNQPPEEYMKIAKLKRQVREWDGWIAEFEVGLKRYNK